MQTVYLGITKHYSFVFMKNGLGFVFIRRCDKNKFTKDLRYNIYIKNRQ